MSALSAVSFIHTVLSLFHFSVSRTTMVRKVLLLLCFLAVSVIFIKADGGEGTHTEGSDAGGSEGSHTESGDGGDSNHVEGSQPDRPEGTDNDTEGSHTEGNDAGGNEGSHAEGRRGGAPRAAAQSGGEGNEGNHNEAGGNENRNEGSDNGTSSLTTPLGLILSSFIFVRNFFV